MSGAVFLFINRRRTCLKLLVYDGQGFWLCQKRLSHGRIRFWPKGGENLTAPQVQVLLYDGDPSGSRIAPSWKPLPGSS
jgi:transposase